MTTINVRIDDRTKTEAVNILHSLGLTTTQAIALFFKQIIYNNGIPFEIKLPNETTIETLEASEKGKDLHKVSSVDKLFEELNS